MAIAFGPPISYTDVQEMSDQELIDDLRQRMLSCHAQTRRMTHSDLVMRPDSRKNLVTERSPGA